MKLCTERLELRPFREDDFEDVSIYASNIENLKYMIWGPNNEEETRKFLKECIEAADKIPRTQVDFAIVEKISGRVIGGCGMYLDKGLKEGMLGWILNKNYWKKGLMVEAARELIKYGFEELKLHRIYATCNVENYGSYRVMEKCGMRREAHFKKNRYGRVGTEDKWFDELHYGILEEEYKL